VPTLRLATEARARLANKGALGVFGVDVTGERDEPRGAHDVSACIVCCGDGSTDC
tara:strand:+ start:506 stop:670 length:165 start_codon:yes stop_codon:yes gene_type:complete